jgi:hypothetical protein
MKYRALNVALLAACVSVGLHAQSSNPMHDDDMMPKATNVTYIGCVEPGTMAHAFVLTHITTGHGGKAMKNSGRGMSGSAISDGHNGAVMMPPPSAVSLKVAPVDVSGHVGHTVSVAGSLSEDTMDSAAQGDSMNHMPVLTVKTVEMVAASCPSM